MGQLLFFRDVRLGLYLDEVALQEIHRCRGQFDAPGSPVQLPRRHDLNDHSPRVFASELHQLILLTLIPNGYSHCWQLGARSSVGVQHTLHDDLGSTLFIDDILADNFDQRSIH